MVLNNKEGGTTDRAWSDLGSNRGLRSESPATTRLSHGTVVAAQIYNVEYLKIQSVRYGEHGFCTVETKLTVLPAELIAVCCEVHSGQG